MRVLNPVGDKEQLKHERQLASRLDMLSGKVIGIVDDGVGKAYFKRIEENYAYTVRLGKLTKSPRHAKYRQKGVDILMAIDALTKAYQNQYETGMFLLGDADFKPLIEAVKNAGKKTIGIFYRPTCPKDLSDSFDWRIWLKKQNFRGFLEDKP